MNLQKLFSEFIEFGFKVRSLHLDGLKSWQEKSADLDNVKEINKWVSSRLSNNKTTIAGTENVYNYLYNELNIKGEESDKSTNPNFEQHHFLLQLVRLPKNDLCSEKKIAQIAYNIGQFMASVGSGVYSQEAITFYHLNNLGRLESYIYNKLDGGYKSHSPVNIYDTFLTMTPLKALNNNIEHFCSDCKSNGKCKSCGTEYISLKYLN